MNSKRMSGLLTWCIALGGVAIAQEPGTTPQEPGTTAKDSVTVAEMEGDVVVWRALAPNAPLVDMEGKASARVSPDDRLGSASGSLARIDVDSAVFVTLSGVRAARDQGLSVGHAKGNVVLKLYRGSIEVSSQEVVSVQTAYGTVEGEATFFLVEVSGDSARVVAVDGKLTFRNDLGKVVLGAGQSSTAGNNAAPGAAVGKATTPANLISNGDFEHGMGGWTSSLCNADKESQSIGASPSKIAHGGKHSALIEYINVRCKGVSALEYHKAGLLARGGRYFLRLWVKGAPSWQMKPGIAIKIQDERMTCPDASRGWRCARFIFEAKPTSFDLLIDPADPSLGGAYQRRGSIWVDDVYLAPMPETDAEAPPGK